MNIVQNLKWIIIDVDGTMTDGGIYYDNYGNELKKFNTKDAIGIVTAHQLGIKLVVLTGRECKATEKRMQELKIDYLFQNIKNKYQFIIDFMKENNIKREEIGYIGDDLNDFLPMKETGYIGCPGDACLEIKTIADYISEMSGGKGAVRDIIVHIAKERGEWDKILKQLVWSEYLKQ